MRSRHGGTAFAALQHYASGFTAGIAGGDEGARYFLGSDVAGSAFSAIAALTGEPAGLGFEAVVVAGLATRLATGLETRLAAGLARVGLVGSTTSVGSFLKIASRLIISGFEQVEISVASLKTRSWVSHEYAANRSIEVDNWNGFNTWIIDLVLSGCRAAPEIPGFGIAYATAAARSGHFTRQTLPEHGHSADLFHGLALVDP